MARAETQKAEADARMQQLARADAALQVGQFKRCQILAQAHQRFVERDVGGEVGQALGVKPGPGAQAADTAANVDRVVNPGAPGSQIDAGQIGIDLAAPRAQIGERCAIKIGAQIEHVGEPHRRRAAQRHAVAVAAAAGDQVNIGQRQLRCGAQLIVPAQARLTDDDAALPEDPV